MPSFLSAFNWGDFIPIIGLWLLTILVSVGVLAWLFPRMEHGEADPSSVQSEVLPWYPIPPRVRQLLERRIPVGPSVAAPFNPAYWRANLRIIFAFLTVWLLVAFLPPLFSGLLNGIHILTGFPLGYYMGSQGAPVVFFGLIVGYAWYMAGVDRRYFPGSTPQDLQTRRYSSRLGLIFLCFTIGFMLFIGGMGVVEARFGLSSNLLGWALLISSIGLYAVIGIGNRTHSLDEYFRRLDGEPPHGIYDMVIMHVERALISSVMERAGGNQTQAADMLGISLKTLYNRLAAYKANEPAGEDDDTPPKPASSEGHRRAA